MAEGDEISDFENNIPEYDGDSKPKKNEEIFLMLTAFIIIIIIGCVFYFLEKEAKEDLQDENNLLQEEITKINESFTQLCRTNLISNESMIVGNIMYNVQENCKLFATKLNISVIYADDYLKKNNAISFYCLINSTDGWKSIPESVITIKRQD